MDPKQALIILFLLLQAGSAVAGTDAPTVSASRLLAAPAPYAGRTVQAHGFLIIEREGSTLWENEDAYQTEQYDRALWLDLQAGLFESSGDKTGRLAIVTGVFDPVPGGFGQPRGATLADVSAIHLDPADRGPGRPWRNPGMVLLAGLLCAGALMGILLALGARTNPLLRPSRR